MKMVNKFLVFVLFLLFLTGIGHGQNNFTMPNTGFPVPPYVKRGLVLYYDSSGYVTNQGKRSYVTFEKIMIIQKVEDQKVIGTTYSLNSQSNMVMASSEILGQGGFGTFYIHPEYAKKMKGKEKFGYKFIDEGAIGYKTENATGKISYDPKSGIFLSMEIVTNDSEAVDIYKGYEYIKLPPLPDNFPQVAKNSYLYNMSSAVQGMGAIPLGSITISPVSFGKQIAKFRLTTTQTQGLSTTKEIYGTTLLGPHYIHPSILKDGTVIFKLTKKDFNYYIQGGTGYEMVAHLVINGIEYNTSYINPQTGIVFTQDQLVGGMGIIRLALNQ